MVDEKGVSLAILGVVAVIAVVGLVLLFSGAKTGNASDNAPALYGGGAEPGRAYQAEASRYGGGRGANSPSLLGHTCDPSIGEVDVSVNEVQSKLSTGFTCDVDRLCCWR